MKIYLSSSENSHNLWTLEQVGKKMSLLATYYYLRKMGEDKVKNVLIRLRAIGSSMMLDSGAYTFLNEYKTRHNIGRINPQKKTTQTDQTPEEYCAAYFEFLRKYKDYFDYIVELDIDAIVGYKKVLEWREQLYNLVGRNKCVIVFHTSIPNCHEEWKRWCVEYKGGLLGIGGTNEGDVPLTKLFKVSVEHKRPVHGFAMTKNAMVTRYPWYSVDSSSWNTGQRFGVVFYYDSADFGVKGFRVQKIGTGYFDVFHTKIYPKIGQYMQVSVDDFVKDRANSRFIDVCNAHAFIEQEKQLTRLWEKRGITFTI